MRLITTDEKEYKISEKDYNKLLARVDFQKAEISQLGYYFLSGNLLCVGRNRKCSKCSLSDSEKKVNSCILLFQRILGDSSLDYLHFFDHGVIWEAEYDKEARHALRKLKVILSSARKQ